MKTQRLSLVFFAMLLVSLSVAGCTGVAAAPAPPEIHYGEDMCSDCGMIINEPRFACAYAHQTDDERYASFIFDDIGDMLLHMAENPNLNVVGWWVHDYHSEEWIDATTAYYVVSDQIKSPMNFGIAAFASAEDAETLADGFGVAVATWDELRSGSEAMSAPAAVHAHAHAAEPAAAAPVGDAEAGRHLYATTCAACHGTDAQGIHGLGKDLTASIFLASLDDAGVVEFLKQGRDSSDPLNTTGVAMPPKAGNPALTDEDLRNITAFLRTGSEHEDAAVNGALGGVETQEEGSGASNTGHQHGGGAAGGDAANLQHRHCGGNGPAGNSPGQGHMHRMRHGHS